MAPAHPEPGARPRDHPRPQPLGVRLLPRVRHRRRPHLGLPVGARAPAAGPGRRRRRLAGARPAGAQRGSRGAAAHHRRPGRPVDRRRAAVRDDQRVLLADRRPHRRVRRGPRRRRDGRGRLPPQRARPARRGGAGARRGPARTARPRARRRGPDPERVDARDRRPAARHRPGRRRVAGVPRLLHGDAARGRRPGAGRGRAGGRVPARGADVDVDRRARHGRPAGTAAGAGGRARDPGADLGRLGAGDVAGRVQRDGDRAARARPHPRAVRPPGRRRRWRAPRSRAR